jgi:hypothetical protein
MPNPWHCSDQKSSAWKAFLADERLRRQHNISDEELVVLKDVELLGEARSTDDFVYVLDMLRSVLKS